MADEITIVAVTGLTPSIQLYNGSTIEGVSFDAAEIGTTGIYLANMPSVAYGKYLVVATAGTERLGAGDIYWDGAQEITPEMYEQIYRLEGLNSDAPMTVTPSSRVAGDINLAITGDGVTSSTVTRT